MSPESTATENVALDVAPNAVSAPGDELAQFFEEDGKIHLGQGVWIRAEVWRRIGSSLKDSIFVKELAVAVWGTATLKNRSITGKECPTKKGEARPPLTPKKLRAVKECFQWWLRHQGVVEEEELGKRTRAMGHYVSQKIMDIRKKDDKDKQK
ncbi:BEN domain-containing protein 5-like [Alosa pseudoharengus]|uniref:BEN domain-containing protein 5-like n=1 Tax=Alosa pseudoharengus TaxID=34774 RepID=UPI003F895B80